MCPYLAKCLILTLLRLLDMHCQTITTSFYTDSACTSPCTGCGEEHGAYHGTLVTYGYQCHYDGGYVSYLVTCSFQTPYPEISDATVMLATYNADIADGCSDQPDQIIAYAQDYCFSESSSYSYEYTCDGDTPSK